jgi:hypothetical protein
VGTWKRGLAIIWVGLAVALVIAGLLDGGPGGARPAEAVASSADCSFPEPPGPGATALGRAHFFGYVTSGWKQGDELQLSRIGKGKWAVKQALEVRGDDPIVFQVPPGSRDSVDLVGWDGVGNGWNGGVDRIAIDLGASGFCHGAWPGGFVITRRQCFSLKVEADDRTARVPFGLGRFCDS